MDKKHHFVHLAAARGVMVRQAELNPHSKQNDPNNHKEIRVVASVQREKGSVGFPQVHPRRETRDAGLHVGSERKKVGFFRSLDVTASGQTYPSPGNQFITHSRLRF
ncbi:hypothetical protein CEXT_592771 [Caerostris extrusa]|uniref:Uncharacterized protein n=1 Tax=Caerostris extrusa TaxID=172846 RepID=A0AAV4MPD1_CAEEX|nr:hypothetical protein CEXT_592771 [Caerostris extrusa]